MKTVRVLTLIGLFTVGFFSLWAGYAWCMLRYWGVL